MKMEGAGALQRRFRRVVKPLATRLWPSLTSVRRQTRDTGRIAASMLIRPDAGPMPVASVRPHLIVRDSCQPPA